jgi:hypothetical protein
MTLIRLHYELKGLPQRKLLFLRADEGTESKIHLPRRGVE